ncbi:hypothetical protein ElyMa_004319200 [Elysia marginata]|uniref:Uncharacterized protein n=1 Tax=Elysia marginata TaxID=1093978 RepID=A0AAV4H1G6_9GAST|nr:hypothetical protein ElyMa_004319200 [Elysia marginata]
MSDVSRYDGAGDVKLGCLHTLVHVRPETLGPAPQTWATVVVESRETKLTSPLTDSTVNTANASAVDSAPDMTYLALPAAKLALLAAHPWMGEGGGGEE